VNTNDIAIFAEKKQIEHPRIALLGAALNTGNMGVSALAISTLWLLRYEQPEAQVALFVGSRDDSPQLAHIGCETEAIPVVNYRLSPKARRGEHALWILGLAMIWRLLPFPFIHRRISIRNRWIRELSRCHVVADIAGGDSFSDIYGLVRFLVTVLPASVAILMRKRLVLLPQSYGPFRSITSRLLAGWIVRSASIVVSRNAIPGFGIRNLMLKGLVRRKAIYCPDVAFSLPVQPVSRDWFIPPLPKRESDEEPLIGLNISGLLFNGGYSGSNMFGLRDPYDVTILALLTKLMDCTGVRIALIPHNFGSISSVNNDFVACETIHRIIVGTYGERLHILSVQRDPGELKGLIGLCDFFIGSRLHACIAGLSQGIPTVGLSYSSKFHGVFDAIGVRNAVIDLRFSRLSEVVDTTLQAYKKRVDIANLLRMNLPYLKQRQREIFHRLFTCVPAREIKKK